MIIQLVNRASYDIIIIENAEFIDTESGRIELNGKRYYLETTNDKDLICEIGEKVFSVEDFSAERVIAIANGVEICGNCHKKFQVPEGNPRLMNVCECPDQKETPTNMKMQGFDITFNEGGWGYIPVADGVELDESFVTKELAIKWLNDGRSIDTERQFSIAQSNWDNMCDEPPHPAQHDGDDFDWIDDEDDLYLDNGDFDHDVESAGGAEAFWRGWEDEQYSDWDSDRWNTWESESESESHPDPNDITTDDWNDLYKVMDKIALNAVNNGGVINYEKFKSEVESTQVHKILSHPRNSNVYDVFLNTFHNGLDHRLEKAGFNPY